MSADFVAFTEGENYLLTAGDGVPSEVYFGLSRAAVWELSPALTLAGAAFGEVNTAYNSATYACTGYARIGQAAPAPVSGQLAISLLQWQTLTAVNWPPDVQSVFAATGSGSIGLLLAAWNLVPSLPAPNNVMVTPASSGGTFTAGNKFWVVTATNAYGESLPSQELQAYVGASGEAALSWGAVASATGYKIYRGASSGGEYGASSLVTTISSGSTTTYTDTGAAASTGAAPTVNSTAGRYNLALINQTLNVIPTLTLSS